MDKKHWGELDSDIEGRSNFYFFCLVLIDFELNCVLL
jgi:hypothetical protein